MLLPLKLVDLGVRHSSVDLSEPTILRPRVRVPSTPSMLSSFIVNFLLYLSCEKKENKQKEVEFGHLKKYFPSLGVKPKIAPVKMVL